MLPVVSLAALFGGIATPVEAAAVTAMYAFLAETVFNRDLSFRRDVPRVAVEGGLVIGGVLLILGVALGIWITSIKWISLPLPFYGQRIRSILRGYSCWF